MTYVDWVYVITLTIADSEEPPTLENLANILYQGIPTIDSEDAVLVEHHASVLTEDDGWMGT